MLGVELSVSICGCKCEGNLTKLPLASTLSGVNICLHLFKIRQYLSLSRCKYQAINVSLLE